MRKAIIAFLFWCCVVPVVSADQLPLVQRSTLKYLGAFKVPHGNLGGEATGYDTLSGGGAGVTFNPNNNSLIMWATTATYQKLVVELSIPAPVISDSRTNLNTATVLQVPYDPTAGNSNKLKLDHTDVANGASVGGFYVDGSNSRMLGNVYAYYDGGYDAYRSHFSFDTHWVANGVQFQGMCMVGVSPNPDQPNGGFVGGYMGHVPPAYQEAFGSEALTGHGGGAVIGRGSKGPSVSTFNVSDVCEYDMTEAPATLLLGYPESHPTLGEYGVEYNNATQYRGVVFPGNSRSVLFFGRVGYGYDNEGHTCYGLGTTDINKHRRFTSEAYYLRSYTSNSISGVNKTFTVDTGLTIANGVKVTMNVHNFSPYYFMTGTVVSYNSTTGELVCSSNPVIEKMLGSGTFSDWDISVSNDSVTHYYCYDLANQEPGYHGYPYQYHVWAYDAEDLLKVKRGDTNPSTGVAYTPWDIVPYDNYDINFPIEIPTSVERGLGGSAYDPATNRIYITENKADPDGFAKFPLVHVYQVLFDKNHGSPKSMMSRPPS